MRKLQSLRLWFLLDVSESTLTFCLSLLTDLQSLELQQMGYLDGKYDFLRAELHQHLTRLTLSGFGLLRGDAMIPIASLRNLKELFLDGDLIDDESLRHLTSLSNLHSLTLYSAPISNLGLKSIASLTNIESLHVLTKRKKEQRKRKAGNIVIPTLFSWAIVNELLMLDFMIIFICLPTWHLFHFLICLHLATQDSKVDNECTLQTNPLSSLWNSHARIVELSVLPKLHRLDLTGSFGNHHPLQNGNRKK